MKNKLVIDLDDTISFCHDRDFENASPNLEVIAKLNTLYAAGWHIEVRTARGSLSVGGTAAQRAARYAASITAWLRAHGVRYHTLSFEKPLATLYVDDKAMRPDEFAALQYAVLPGGLSTAHVYRVGQWVFKTHSSETEALAVVAWYKKARHAGLTVPLVLGVAGATVQLQYVEDNAAPELEYLCRVLEKICNTVDSEKKIVYGWDTYLQRCGRHAELIKDDKLKTFCLSQLDTAKRWNTAAQRETGWCHGDFTLDNVLGGSVLIDPIPMHDCWSSWLLDVSKLAHSYSRRFQQENRQALYQWVTDEKHIDPEFIAYLEWTHWLRLLKYIPSENKDLILLTETKLYAGCH